MVRSSFMKNTDIYSMRPFVFWPKEMLWSNYTDALKAADFGRYAINTITIVAGCLIGTLLTSSMAAYAFSRIKWTGPGLLLCPGALHDDASRFRYPDPTVHDLEKFPHD